MMKIQKFVMMLVLGAMVVTPMVVNGQFSIDTKSQHGAAGKVEAPVDIINKAIGFVLSIIAGLSILMIVFAGFMYILSGGNDEKIGTAKGMLMYAVIGLVVALLGFAIVTAVSQFVITGT